MGKSYQFEIKLKIVQEYLNGKLAQKYGLSHHSMVLRWTNPYLEFGPDALDKKARNKSYTRDFKVSVSKFRQENKLSYREIADYFKISNISSCEGSHQRIMN